MNRAVTFIFGLSVLAVLSAAPGLAQDQPKKVSKAEAITNATAKPQPEYPSVAKQFKVEGMVELEAVIGETGKVEKVNILSGNAMLTRAASEALKGWKFSPFVEDGKPVKVLAPVSFTFRMYETKK